MPDVVHWSMTISGGRRALKVIAGRLSAGLGDHWTADRCDVPCVVRPDLWGDLGCGTGQQELLITPHGETMLAEVEDGRLRLAGVAAEGRLPVAWAERVTNLHPVVVDLQVEVRRRYYESWFHALGMSIRTGGGNCLRHEPWQQPWSGEDPLKRPHHQTPRVSVGEAGRLRRTRYKSRLLPPRPPLN